MSKDIGKMGESTFLNLCNQVDITANPSNVDRFGWDYILEFLNNYKTSSLPIDMQDMAIECKVQVKATDTNNGKCQIKLSAIHSLVKYNYPAFICFINYNKGIEPYEIFIVHIDKNIIFKVLKSVRKNEIKHKKLNKVKITIDYNNQHKLDSINGKSLKLKLEEAIVKGMTSYIKNKNSLLKSVGFSENSLTAKFTIDNMEMMNLINSSLGLENALIPIENQSLILSRFDIPMPFDSLFNSANNLKMSIKAQKNGKVTLYARKDKFSKPLKYKLDVYTTPFSIEGKSKMVLKNANLRFIIDFIENKHSLKFEFSELYIFSDLYNNLKLVKIMSENKKIYMSLEKDNKFLMNFTMEDNKDIFINGLFYYELVSMLMQICKELEINIETKVSLNDIEKNLFNIRVLHHYIFGDFLDLIMTSILEERIDTKKINLKKGAYLVPISLSLNGYLIIVYMIFLTNNEIYNQNEFKFIPYQRIIYNIFYKRYSESSEIFYLDLHKDITKDLRKDDINIVIHQNSYIYEFNQNVALALESSVRIENKYTKIEDNQ